MNLASLPGSSRHRPLWRISTSSTPSSPALAAPSLACSSPFSPLPFTSGLTRCSFAFFSSVVFVFLFLFRLAPAGGRPLDVLGHHRAACSTSGVLGRRGFALESAAGRICREPGARVSGTWTWILLVALTVVAQRGCSFSMVLGWPLTLHGEPHRQCATSDGAALHAARRRKERTFPELSGTQMV